ncbi:MAG: copper homeostasis membrane protein CopD [Caulobacteraceae bacterium]
MEIAVVLARLGQYLGSAGLFGGALFLARQPNAGRQMREQRLLIAATVLLELSTLGALVAQAASMAGETSPFTDPSMVGMVMTSTTFGFAVAVRLVATASAMVVLMLRPTRWTLGACAALGAVGAVTLAWGGHCAADEGVAGVVHLGADMVHLLAAGLWIGALGALTVMTTDRGLWSRPEEIGRLHAALGGFSGVGTLAVGLLIATGLVNSWLLIGPRRLDALITTLYGRLLLAKLILFAIMTALAAANRWRLKPRLGKPSASGAPLAAVAALRASLGFETALAFAVLALVAWLGTLAPPISGGLG